MDRKNQKKHQISLDADIYRVLISGHIILSECGYFLDKAKLSKKGLFDLYITESELSELLDAVVNQIDNTYPEERSKIGDLENIYICLRGELRLIHC